MFPSISEDNGPSESVWHWTVLMFKAFPFKTVIILPHIPLIGLSGIALIFEYKWANPGLFFVSFWSFQSNITILQQINVKKCHVHPVYGAGIQTYNLWNVSLFPKPLDQGYLVYLIWYYYLSVKYVIWIVKRKIENNRNLSFLKKEESQIWRLWVWLPAPENRWTFFHITLL